MAPRTPFIVEAAAAGATATVATTMALALSGSRLDVTPWAPINAVSHILYGDEAADHVRASAAYTATGALLNAAAMFAWSGVYALLRRGVSRRSPASAIGAAAATSVIAYVVDYHVVPRRLTPGFEKRLPPGAISGVYGALALGLAAGSLITEREGA